MQRQHLKAGWNGPGAAAPQQLAPLQLVSCRRYLNYMKYWLFGDEGHEPTKDAVITLAAEIVKTDFLLMVVQQLTVLGFEARKDAAQVFGAVVRIKDQNDACPGARHVEGHLDILQMLFQGCAAVPHQAGRWPGWGVGGPAG